MAASKNNSKRLIEIVLVIFIVVGIGLILADMTSNVIYEIDSGKQMEAAVQEIEPTPVPTLTDAERQEMLSEPVGEDGE